MTGRTYLWHFELFQGEGLGALQPQQCTPCTRDEEAAGVPPSAPVPSPPLQTHWTPLHRRDPVKR